MKNTHEKEAQIYKEKITQLTKEVLKKDETLVRKFSTKFKHSVS